MIQRTFSICCLLHITIACIFLTTDALQAKESKANGSRKPITPIQPIGFIEEAGKNTTAECLKRSLDFYISIMAKRKTAYGRMEADWSGLGLYSEPGHALCRQDYAAGLPGSG
jgi:hypothetical protein